jgi:predicted nuclease of predicted toxin-antitoxin system
MRIYLDDDIANGVLAALLRKAGHDTQVPGDVRLAGAYDPVHLTHAIRDNRVLVSQNYDDFKQLHDLLMAGRGNHPGVLIVRKDNNPNRDMKTPHIVRAVRNLLRVGVAIANEFTILNDYR